MFQGLVVWFVSLLVAMVVVNFLSSTYRFADRRLMTILFFYHSGLALAYYLYATFNPSDSSQYYATVSTSFTSTTWLDYMGAGTDFVEFLAYPLIQGMGFTYESCMVVFAFFGYLGFLFFYIFFKERIFNNPRIFGFDGAWMIFLLPNLHFWSASLGKGSVIFLGFGLFFYSLKAPLKRLPALIIGGWLIYMVRSHIFFVVLIAIALGFTFSSKGVSTAVRLLILVVAAGLLVYIYEDILRITGLENESMFNPMISHRAAELSKASSGIDITNYSIPEKIFAFCFRPLFFDAGGMLGLIVSFENLFYLIMFVRILAPSHLRNLLKADAIVKTCFLTFAGVAFALAQITGNLGLAMRQKSQVMILMMFVVLKLLDTEITEIKRTRALQRERIKRMEDKLKMAGA